MKYLVLSCSLNPESKSAIMARLTHDALSEAGETVEWVDLADHPLPLCDAGEAYSDPNVAVLAEKIAAADGIVVGAPIYNFDVNAAVKNLLELTGQNWRGKVVSFVLAAGGEGSYMAIMPFANSLMLDFRCVIVPRFVYATGKAFEGNDLADLAVKERIAQLAEAMRKITAGVRGA